MVTLTKGVGKMHKLRRDRHGSCFLEMLGWDAAFESVCYTCNLPLGKTIFPVQARKNIVCHTC